MMIQDIYRAEPWKMVVCTILLNQTSGIQVKKMMRRFFKRFDSIEKICISETSDISSEIEELGLQNVKADRIKSFCEYIRYRDRFYEENVSNMPGAGEYSEESIDVFVRRNIDREVSDKEIKRYLDRSIDFSVIKSKAEGDIFCEGTFQPIARYAPKEILNYIYEYDSKLFCRVTDDRLKYVNDKLTIYKDALADVNYRLKWNDTNRQSVIQFDQSGILPNCTVSIQFQIRDSILYLSIFQRSQDVEKMEMDCEIFNRMALEVIKNQENIDEYKVKVFVGNMHDFKFKKR